MKLIIEKEMYEGTIESLLEEEIKYLPYWTVGDLKERCDIVFEHYGFVHDYGFVIKVYDHEEDRDGKGWDSVEDRLREEIATAKERWRVAQEYSYRGTE